MDEAEERFLRVTIGYLATHTRSLAIAVGTLNAAIRESVAGEVAEALAELDKDLLDMEESLARIVQAFPPELPGGSTGNGGRLH